MPYASWERARGVHFSMKKKFNPIPNGAVTSVATAMNQKAVKDIRRKAATAQREKASSAARVDTSERRA